VSLAVAVVQHTAALYEAARNRAATVELIDAAAARGAQFVVLPELVVSGYGADPEGLARAAEPADGETLAAWTAAARRHGLHVCGGFAERDGDRLYNSAMLVGPDGLVGVYRKLHLFDREMDVFTPGDRGLPVYALPFGTVGICVCYDLRFVEVARALALQGADLVAVPTAWTGGFDADPFDAMGYIGQARGALVQANLNQVFLACASQAGTVGDVRFLGSSLIVDPYGEAVVGPLGPDEQTIATATVDLRRATAAQVRTPRIRPRLDRRTDVYGLALDGRPL
jgi:N-carbamoylputrescine amidase